MEGDPLVIVQYPEVKVGDLVRMICHARFCYGSDVGLVIEVADCGKWADDITVLCDDGSTVEWEQDEVEVIDESR